MRDTSPAHLISLLVIFKGEWDILNKIELIIILKRTDRFFNLHLQSLDKYYELLIVKMCSLYTQKKLSEDGYIFAKTNTRHYMKFATHGSIGM
jgi:hypothetical protein